MAFVHLLEFVFPRDQLTQACLTYKKHAQLQNDAARLMIGVIILFIIKLYLNFNLKNLKSDAFSKSPSK